MEIIWCFALLYGVFVSNSRPCMSRSQSTSSCICLMRAVAGRWRGGFRSCHVFKCLAKVWAGLLVVEVLFTVYVFHNENLSSLSAMSGPWKDRGGGNHELMQIHTRSLFTLLIHYGLPITLSFSILERFDKSLVISPLFNTPFAWARLLVFWTTCYSKSFCSY